MTKRLDDRDNLEDAVAFLVKVEPRFSLIIDRHGLPPLRQAEPGLKSLLRIVTDQVISLKAGEAIWTRIIASLDSFTPDDILARSENEFRAFGLSAAKARAFHAAAQAYQAGNFSPEAVAEMTEREVFAQLMDIPGVGPWTANLYLLTVHGAADVWPAGDIALQHAAHHLFGLPRRPGARELNRLAEPWRPCRSTAALLLWSHYRSLSRPLKS